MPKKTPPNAFFCFMQEYRHKEERRGRRFPNGLRDVQEQAGEIWKQMSAEERAPYKERSKNDKLVSKQKEEKYTSQGVPFSALDKKKCQKETLQRDIKKNIEETIQSCYLNNTLATFQFHVIAANYFVEAKGGFYIPAEIALAEFSLQDGITNTYHSFINPGQLPLGMAFAAQEYAVSTHNLPNPPNAIGEKDFTLILKQVVEFITNTAADELPPLYTTPENIPIIQSIISQFCMDAEEEVDVFRIYPLDELFLHLKNAAAKYGLDQEKSIPSIHIAKAIIDRDQYEYRTGISCDYHEKSDGGKYCALSIVKRWCFIFADHICLDLAISPIAGQHLPVGTDITIVSTTLPIKNEAEDVKSCISYKSYASTSVQTNITQPKYEKRAPGVQATGCEIGDDSAKRNPWSIRSSNKPRKPNEDSFNFGSVVSGKGRGIMHNANRTADSSSFRSLGRGHLLTD